MRKEAVLRDFVGLCTLNSVKTGRGRPEAVTPGSLSAAGYFSFLR